MASFDGTRLASRRAGRGWSQVELAERVQRARGGAVTPEQAARQIRTLIVQVSCYESGSTRPRARMVRLLTQVLEADVLDLLAENTVVTLDVLRARLGLTQHQVAVQLGVSRSLYALIEQGRQVPAEAEVAALAAVLQVSADRVRQALPDPVGRAGPLTR